MSVDFDALVEQARALLTACSDKKLTLVTAESCTGGLIAAVLTEIPGSSVTVERGFVTYTNEAKTEQLGVPAGLIERHGAVSEEVARAMAEGALGHSHASLAVAVTGIAGPDGGTATKPVGLVHFAAARRNGKAMHRERRFGDIGRGDVRRASVAEALALVNELL
jgi:nicotinamide-nucleotide amidase